MDFAIEGIKEFLSSPDASEKISSMMDALGVGGDNGEKTSLASDIPIESVMKIANIYKSMNSEDDKGIKLLRAIKPYVRKSRTESVETAIKFLSLAKLAPLLGDIKEVL